MPNLVGIGNSQVPTNAMLGGLAYKDFVGEINIEKIKARAEDTATDIFVYDTSKDSDGGAWRHRTQNTSWYNEGASATRGTRKEFPSVAVIVCFTSGLAIYDGDDPNLPLWMEWTTTNGTYMLRGPTNGRIAAMNGIIALSNASTYGGMVAIYFISDTSRSYRQLASSNKSEGYFIGNGIAARNSFSGNCYSNGSGGNVLPSLVDENSRDVAITVLPNAPTDPDTGLPIPTIAVATIGGTSIIKHDGTAVDIVYTSSPSTSYVNFRESDNAIVMSMNSNASYVHVIYNVPSSDISGSHQYQKEGIDDEFYRTRSSSDWNQDVWIYAASPYGGSTVRIANNVISGNGGINVLSPNKHAIATDTMVALIKSSHNTGYMHGDIQLAYLSDTDDTDLTGGEIITGNNSTFGSGVGNWAGGANSGSPTVSNNSNRLYVDSNASSYPRVQLNVGTQPAGTYTLSGKYYYSGGFPIIVTGTGGGSYVLDEYGGDDVAKLNEGTNLQRDFSRTFTITSSFDTIGFRMNVAGGTHIMHFDDLQLIRAERNRTTNANHLRAFGTITKNPVETGAELVSYSFAANSYLTMPYDTDIVHVGSGNFNVMGWFYNTPRGATYFDIASAASPRFFIAQMYNSDNFWFYMNTGSGGQSWTTGGGGIELRNGWQFIAVKRVGTTFSFSLNGRDFVSQTAAAWGGSISGGSPYITLGQNYTNSSTANSGQMALWRFSHSDISIGQVKKIYNDEKKLFGKNAKCTIYGTSDAVTGLGFDKSNDILHVGTSAGRSEFQGLSRINNTTTAVTTEISASDGLVAEQ